MLYIAPDKLQSTLGLKLPPVFTFLPCLASPLWQGGRHALQGHHGPKYQLLPMEQLNLVTGPDLWDYIGNKVQENSGRQFRREI